jgi:hypothetical protein
MRTYRQDLIISAFTLAPYLLVAWGFTVMTDNEASTFWKALLVLSGLRIVFAFIDMLGGVLRWRLWGRSVSVANALTWFTARQFPQRKYADDDMGNYLARIEQDPEQSLALRMAAAELGRLFLIYEDFGIFVGSRFHDAYKVAFEQYAPPTRASKRSVTEEPWFRGGDNSGQAKGRSNEEAL